MFLCRVWDHTYHIWQSTACVWPVGLVSSSKLLRLDLDRFCRLSDVWYDLLIRWFLLAQYWCFHDMLLCIWKYSTNRNTVLIDWVNVFVIQHVPVAVKEQRLFVQCLWLLYESFLASGKASSQYSLSVLGNVALCAASLNSGTGEDALSAVVFFCADVVVYS